MAIQIYHTQFFDIIQVDLGVAHEDAEVDVAGNVIAVAQSSGTCYVKFNSKSAPALEINQLGALDFGDLPVAFTKLYITNTAQSGASITLITSNVAKLSVAPQYRGVVQDYPIKAGAWLTSVPEHGVWAAILTCHADDVAVSTFIYEGPLYTVNNVASMLKISVANTSGQDATLKLYQRVDLPDLTYWIEYWDTLGTVANNTSNYFTAPVKGTHYRLRWEFAGTPTGMVRWYVREVGMPW